MTQQTFTDNVLIDGSRDIEQLRVQGHTTQSEPLQTWENSAQDVLAQVSGDGNVQIGDDLLGWSTPDALLEAHRADTSTSKPKRGVHSLGQVSGTLNALVQWLVGELELRGSTAIDALHTALRIRASNINTGTPTANAELRGADIEVINESGAGTAALTKATGLQVGITNASGKTISEAIGVRVKMNNGGTITNPYAIYAEGPGVAHFEDYLETKYPATVPGKPATDFIRIYGKSDGKLYAKNWIGANGEEFDLTSLGIIPARYRSGLRLVRIDNATLKVSLGEIIVNGTLVEKTTQTNLGMATGADWIGGSSNEASSAFANIYVDAAGNLKLHNKFPNYPRPNTASRVFTALVNQSGWNGTSGSGLDATSVVYDNDTGENNIKPGMLLGVYGSADTDYGQGRGKGSGAGAGVTHSSWAFIEAVNTATNTLTLSAGHQIAINDNDRLMAVEAGELLYRDESSTWYRWLGAIYNDASSNLEANHTNDYARSEIDNDTSYSTASTTFVDVDSTNLNLTIITNGVAVNVKFLSFGGSSTTSDRPTHLNINQDGVDIKDGNGLPTSASNGTGKDLLHLDWDLILPPGTHTFKLRFKAEAGTTYINQQTGTGGIKVHGYFSVREGAAA